MANSNQTPVGPEDASQHPTLYLNIMVLSTPDDMIQEKIDEKVPSPFGFKGLRGLAKTVISKRITEDVIAGKLAEKMPEALPDKMKEMGIEAECAQVFRRGAFVVVCISILHADVSKIITDKSGEETGKKVDKALAWTTSIARWMGKQEQLEESINNKMTQTIATQMCNKLSEVLPTKLGEKGIEVNVKALMEEDEAQYFFGFLSLLDAEANEAEEGSAKSYRGPGHRLVSHLPGHR